MKISPIKARAWTTVLRTLTYVVAIAAVLLSIKIISQNRQLAQSAKALGEQNQQISIENQKHIDCIADLFARYTRDNRPITIIDLDTCKASQQDVMQILDHGSTSTTLPVPASSNNKNTQPTTSNTQQNAAPEQTPPTEVLGIPLCVPLTGICVR